MFGIRKFYLALLFNLVVVCPALSLAQKPLDDDKDTRVLYRKEFTAGFIAHSNGWGVGMRRSHHKTGYSKTFWEIDFISVKHPKEIKSSYYENAKGYVYGKMNSFLVLRAGYGFHKIIFSKGRADGSAIEVRYLGSAGSSLGITKPYFVDVIKNPYAPDGGIVSEAYDPNNPLHNQYNIYGRGAWYKGFDKMSLHPGIYGKFGFSFDYAGKEKGVKTIETGMILDYYFKNIPMMAFAQNNSLWFSFYVSLNFGGKWNGKASTAKEED
jgi:hypothetical protein